MKKNYSNKQMTSEDKSVKNKYFFPHANPPVTIEADSQEEAHKILEAKNK